MIYVQIEIQTHKIQKKSKSKPTDDSIKMFCERDSIVLKMFASFINSKLSVTVQFDEGLACEYNTISHTDKAGRINQ